MPARRPPPRVLPRTAAKRPPFDASDENRVGLKPFSPGETMAALYEVSAAGRVYRDDGRLLAVSKFLRVKLNDNRTDRSLPDIVYRAFGRVRPPTDKHYKWDAWVPPETPVDPLTKRRSCSVHDVVLVPRSELIRVGRGLLDTPQTRIRIV